MRRYSIIFFSAREERFSACLEGFLRQTIAPEEYEIVVVTGTNGGRIDALIDGARKEFSRHTVVRLAGRRMTRGEAWRIGMEQATGEFLLFADDAHVVPPAWLQRVRNEHERDPEIGIVWTVPETVGADRWGRFARYVYHFIQKSPLSNPPIAIKTNIPGLLSFPIKVTFPFSLPKSLLERLGGFERDFATTEGIFYDLWLAACAAGCFSLFLPMRMYAYYAPTGIVRDFFLQGRDFTRLAAKYPSRIGDPARFTTFIFFLLARPLSERHFLLIKISRALLLVCGAVFAKLRRARPQRIAAVYEDAGDDYAMSRVDLQTSEVFDTMIRKYTRRLSPPVQGEHAESFSTVVIPTHNRAAQLAAALQSLLYQAPPSRYEILVVDDGSTDHTAAVVKEMAARHSDHRIRYIRQDNAGPARARNTGIANAKGELIFFTDDDCVVPPRWMMTLRSHLVAHPHLAGVGGWYASSEDELRRSAMARYIRYSSFFSHSLWRDFLSTHAILSRDPCMALGVFAYNTANICYRKGILERMGGFSEAFYWPGNEDNELAFRIMRQGYPLLYIPVHVTHPMAMSIRQFARVQFRRSANGYLLCAMHREIMERLMPGSVERFESIANFITKFAGPKKFFSLIEWASRTAGKEYMAWRLERDIVAGKARIPKHNERNPILAEPEKEVRHNR